MNAIYEPRGAAREYADLAVNLYTGCPHGCTYCYAPACLRTTKQAFHALVVPRDNILARVEADCRKLAAANDQREILLCFTCDPYPAGRDSTITRHVLEVIGEHGLMATVLTKNGPAARRDFDLMARHGFRFGTSLSFLDGSVAEWYEPGTPDPWQRIAAIWDAIDAGIRTWVSVEPVIIPAQALAVMEQLSATVDKWAVGKWNHDAEAATIDWKQFLTNARLALHGCNVTFKNALLQAAGNKG